MTELNGPTVTTLSLNGLALAWQIRAFHAGNDTLDRHVPLAKWLDEQGVKAVEGGDLPPWVCECDRPDRNDGDEWHRWSNACAMWAEIADRLRTVRREELS